MEENRIYFCYWIIKEQSKGLISGGYPDENNLEKLIKKGVDVWINLGEDISSFPKGKILNCPIPDEGVCRDSTLFDIVEKAYSLLKRGNLIYVYRSDGDTKCGVFISCFLMRYYGWSSNKAIERSKFLYFSRKSGGNKELLFETSQLRQISRYRPPVTVIVSGDRDSANSFRKIMIRALKDLPKGSTVIHGASKGIDTISGEIAKELGLKVKEFPLSRDELETMGVTTANSIRRRRMLERNPDFMLAFHPDIIHSKGTKDMMISAYLEDIPVYLYDLKNKKKFKGDINSM